MARKRCTVLSCVHFTVGCDAEGMLAWATAASSGSPLLPVGGRTRRRCTVYRSLTEQRSHAHAEKEVINAKCHRLAAMSSMGYASLANPITKSGRVVFNAKKDARHIRIRQFGSKAKTWKKGKVNDELYSILNHEIAVHVTGGAHNQHRMNSYGGAIPVITSCNGWQNSVSPSVGRRHKIYEDEESVKDDSTYNVTFAGIAATRALHDTKDMSRNEEDCVVQSGGLCTIFNGGHETIDVNQWVYWDFPEIADRPRKYAQPEGVPKDKKQFVPRPLMKAMLRASEDFDIRSRVFGRALSRAAPGQSFDVLLGCYL